jgi:hypothetical protein
VVGFLLVAGNKLRCPFCNWRARLAETIMKRYVLASDIIGNAVHRVNSWLAFHVF